jgi:hypothetical protein
MWSQLRSRRTRRAIGSEPAKTWRAGSPRRAAVETLERRCLLFAAPTGPEFLVNTFITGPQQNAAIASDADGDFVVAWQSTGQDGSAESIHAQRYSAAGAKQGIEFRVNVTTTGAQTAPAVAMDSTGNFIVAWQSATQDGSGQGIYARRYGPDGTALSSEFLVNTTTANDQIAPAVAADADGDFVIAWQSNGNDTSGYGIFARRFDASGAAQGAEFQVNTFFALQQTAPAIAMDANGDFVIAWQSSNQEGPTSGSGVYAQQFNSDGSLVGGEIHVNTTVAGEQHEAAVAMDSAGEFVIAWTSGLGSAADVYAQRFSSAAAPLGTECRVNTTTTGVQSTPSIAADADGNFVVAWQNSFQDGSGNAIYSQQYAADGSLIGPEVRVNTNTSGDRNAPAVAADTDGNFVVAWQSSSQDGSGYGVYGQRFHHYELPVVLGVFTAGGSQELTAGESIVEHPQQIVVALSEELSTSGGDSGFHSVTNPENWHVTRNGESVDAEIAGITFAFNHQSRRYEAVVSFDAPLLAGQYQLTLDDRVENLAGVALDGDANEIAGGDFSRSFVVRQIAPLDDVELRVNTTYTTNEQSNSDVAVAPDGRYVIVWQSFGPGGTNFDIYAQQYSAGGIAQGAAMLVNSTVAGDQTIPAVSINSTGEFVVAWRGPDASGTGIFARRFSAAGAAIGGDLAVNATTASDQTTPDVAVNDNGSFVVTWHSFSSSTLHDVFFQRFNSSGAKIGTQVRANTSTSFSQAEAGIGMDAAGNFVIVWNDYISGSSTATIRGQRYNADGAPLGSEFLAVTSTSYPQYGPTVARSRDGKFIVAWLGRPAVGQSFIYAQAFDSNGEKVGAERLVSEAVTELSSFASVAADRDGDFVAVWRADDPSDFGFNILGQHLAADGSLQGKNFRVNMRRIMPHENPAVAMDADGNFVVAWQTREDTGYDIRARRYGVDDQAPRVKDSYVDTVSHTFVVEFDEDVRFGDDQSVAAANVPVNTALWKLYRSGVDITSQITGIVYTSDFLTHTYRAVVTLPAALADGVYTLSLQDEVLDLAGFKLDGNGDGAQGGDFTKRFNVFGFAPAGEETRVNTITLLDQTAPAVGVDAAGNYVVVWQNYTLDGLPTEYDDIYGQRYTAGGVKIGGQFLINTHQQYDQYDPSIAMNASGEFVVVWTSEGQDEFNGGIYGQRFFANGQRSGGEFMISVSPTANQTQPAVAIDADGNFAATWYSYSGQDGSGGGIYGRRFNAAGVAQGGEFLVNQTIESDQEHPAIAMDAKGNLIIAWEDSRSLNPSGSRIYARRYGADGVALSDQFRVNTTQGGEYPTIAIDTRGNFAIAYSGDRRWIRMQRYNAAGEPIGDELVANNPSTRGQYGPTAAYAANGDLVVTWYSDPSGGGEYDIFARRYSSHTSVVSELISVNATLQYRQHEPAVAIDSVGNFVIAWSSRDQDGDGYGIYMQRYAATQPLNVAGDFDFDGDVDGADFCIWQTNFPMASGATQATGDADGDGDVDGADFVVWQTNFPTAASPGSFEPQAGSGSAASAPAGAENNSAADSEPANSPAASAGAGTKSPILFGARTGGPQPTQPGAASRGQQETGGKAAEPNGKSADPTAANTSGMSQPALPRMVETNGLAIGAVVKPSPTTTALVYAAEFIEVATPPKRQLLSPIAVDYWMQKSSIYRSR